MYKVWSVADKRMECTWLYIQISNGGEMIDPQDPDYVSRNDGL